MTTQQLFLKRYNTLDATLKKIIGGTPRSGVKPYILTLPPTRAKELEDLRTFRNNFGPAHSVLEMAQIPYSWIQILERELKIVSNQSEKLKPKLLQACETLRQQSKKRDGSQKPVGLIDARTGVQKAPVRTPKTGIKSAHEFRDPSCGFVMNLEIKKGQGRVLKRRIFGTEECLDFSINFSHLGKLKDMTAYICTDKGEYPISLRPGANAQLLPVSNFSNRLIKVRVRFEYKVGGNMTKKDTITVGKYL